MLSNILANQRQGTSIKRKKELRLLEVHVRLKNKKELVLLVQVVSSLVYLEEVDVCSVQDLEITAFKLNKNLKRLARKSALSIKAGDKVNCSN